MCLQNNDYKKKSKMKKRTKSINEENERLSETKLLGPQAIERNRQNIWPINTEKSWQKKRETHTPP
jgi:hypothetical protein